ncbi:MAG TPA: GNAT family N-acetyltransferase [Candidatus Saccharimonadales bacterium]
MTSLSEVRIEIANPESDTTKDANSILHAFAHSMSSQVRQEPDQGFQEKYLNSTSAGKAVIVAVGYQDEVAVSAASLCEAAKQPDPYDDDIDRLYYKLPFIGINLIARDKEYRGNGYGKQLVHAVVKMAKDSQYDRVQAIWPVDDRARAFWASCGFEPVPYLTFGADMALSTEAETPQEVITKIAPEVTDRLRASRFMLAHATLAV